MKRINDAQEGILVIGNNGNENNLSQSFSPRGLIVDQLGQIYVTDNWNHQIMRWYEGDKERSIVVGGNGKGAESNMLNRSIELLLDQQENLYDSDCANNRIQKFEIY